MRSIYLMAAMAAMTVMSCSQNDITEVSPDANPVVGFSAYTGVQSRGTVTDLDALKGATGGFGVLAYYTGQTAWAGATDPTPNFMYNQKVTYATNAWGYTPVKYWPNTAGDQVSFFAYGPYDAPADFPTGTTAEIDNGIVLSEKTATGTPKLTFTLKDAGNEEEMVDLVVAKVTDATKKAEAIDFKFAHALSRVNFTAKLDKTYAVSGTNPDGKTHVVITGVTFLGSTAEIGSKFYKESTYDLSAGTWTGTASTDNYELAADKVLEASTALTFGTPTVTTTSTGIEVAQNGDATALFKADQYLFLIPVNGATGLDASNKVVVKLEYDIVTEDAALDGGYSKTPCIANIPLTDGTLQQGKAYNYTFKIGLTEVKVDATVDVWDETDQNQEINTPAIP